jgi:hypothetical protein
MRSIKLMGIAGATALALSAFVGVSSAAAVSWSPQNTVEQSTVASGSKLVFKDNKGFTVTCTSASNGSTNSYTEAPVGGNPAVAGSVNSRGQAAPPQFGGCTNSLLPSDPTTVTASGQWLFTATSTTTVNGSNASAVINIGNGACKITISNASAPNNSWSNSTHQLTLNGNDTFPISQSGFFCDGATSGSQSGTLQSPSTVTIG